MRTTLRKKGGVVESEDQESDKGNGTNSFHDDDPFLIRFREHLISRHGKSRSHAEALRISREISRYLYFAFPQGLSESRLLDVSCLDRYLKFLEESGLQPSTQNAKLCRLRQGVDFLSLGLDDSVLPKVEQAKHFMKNWASVIGKQARMINRRHLEDIWFIMPAVVLHLDGHPR